MKKALSVFECQPGLFCRPTGAACYAEPYVYLGRDSASGLHRFRQGAKHELFGRTKNAPASWHLKRGAYCFEFARSAENPPDSWVDCGCCGCCHPPDFTGDCRDDANRWPA